MNKQQQTLIEDWEYALELFERKDNLRNPGEPIGLCSISPYGSRSKPLIWVRPYFAGSWWWEPTNRPIRYAALYYIIKRLKGRHNKWLAPFSRLYFTILTIKEYELP